jgi:pilus assembly protein CpaF
MAMIGSVAGQSGDLLRTTREMLEELVTGLDHESHKHLSEADQRAAFQQAARNWLAARRPLLSQRDRDVAVKMLLDEVFGLGPLEDLLADPTITDILINGPKTIYVERSGRLSRVDVKFENAEHLLRIVQRVVNRIGKLIDETHPMVDGRLADGSRLNAIIHPLARKGPYVSIRKFPRAMQVNDLLARGALAPDMAAFLRAAILARMNILISGGTGSGKTTLLNALSSYIPASERVVTIEDAAELQLQQDHVLSLETRPPNVEGAGTITQRDLVRNSLRMRPDRIIVGECRGGEALDMLQAMNTGHDGSLTTIHANSTTDALARLEMLVEMAGVDIPVRTIRRQIASAVQLVVQIARLQGGARKVIGITEVTGFDGDQIETNDLFLFEQTGVDDAGNAQGDFAATGNQPKLSSRFVSKGLKLPEQMFVRQRFQADENTNAQ